MTPDWYNLYQEWRARQREGDPKGPSPGSLTRLACMPKPIYKTLEKKILMPTLAIKDFVETPSNDNNTDRSGK